MSGVSLDIILYHICAKSIDKKQLVTKNWLYFIQPHHKACITKRIKFINTGMKYNINNLYIILLTSWVFAMQEWADILEFDPCIFSRSL